MYLGKGYLRLYKHHMTLQDRLGWWRTRTTRIEDTQYQYQYHKLKNRPHCPWQGWLGCTDAPDHHIGLPAILAVILYFSKFHSTYQHKNLEPRQTDIKHGLGGLNIPLSQC